ncbi:MAG: ribosome assembly factor SBDS [Candidatus Diapherotrites archaeon]|uniref:Ribosome maturation protein SDO1 homolog n=1 Tax=Candidatus Iainarchaeum sp. TaxID=3101447 RepID=A0A7J4ISN8_9ARCH|nr:MAG: ribosome maturation protein SDO1 [archaeon GW2011_AR10]MBS3059704.1 ribosome assembly factor SBDS [Candidatus Diapherotrites archaeon]HIH07840.1 ribosome assembly factor SBDS [Candidatus Diapherotrites archaeon]
MVKLEDAVIARFEKQGEKFEMLVDPYLAMDLKNGKEVNFDELLAVDTVFKDAKKGEEKKEEQVKAAFGSTDVKTVARKIIGQGEVQLTTQQRREIAEKKRRELINFIARNAINPQTNGPHPVSRIENAIEEAKVSIDLNRGIAEQAPIVLKAIKRLIPISMDKLRLAVKVPAAYAARASGILHKYELMKEEWQTDGSIVAVLEVPAGIKQELFSELNSLTHGNFESKILEETK